VEASLDIDADVLFTEIAPLDALVQRMGRVLRRYKDSIPEEPKDPNVYIIVFSEGYESGNKHVYEKELIEKTIAILNSSEEIINSNEKQLIEIIKKYYDKKGNFIGFIDNKVDGEKSKTKKGKRNKKEENDEELIKGLKMETSISFLLSEYEKFILVSKLYESLSKEGNYLKKFYDTLDILDAGYISDRKTEAQRMFREISSISVIPTNKKEEFEKSIIDFFNNIPEQKEKQKGLYTKFKKDVLAKYVVSVPMYKSYDKCVYTNSVEYWADTNSNFDFKISEKLKSWCKEIYFVDYKYDSEKGVNNLDEE